MIDIIILTFTIAVFFAGVYVGNAYGGVSAVYKKAKAWVRSKLDDKV